MSAAAQAKPVFDARAHFLEGARAAQAALPEATGGLAALRAAGLAALETATWPTAKTESWKYSRLTKLLDAAFISASAGALGGIPAALPEESLGACVLSAVVGLVVPQSALPDGVTLQALSAMDDCPAALLPTGEAFDALNAAMAPEAYVLTVAPGVRVDEPLLLELAQGAPGTFLRIAVRLGEGSSLTLFERQSGDDQAFFSTACNLTLEAGAQLTHQRIGLAGGEGRWLSQHGVTVGSQAHYALLLAQGGAAFRRNELGIDLRGHGATVAVSGASLTDGAQHLDTQLAMNHCEPHGTSTQRFRALAAGQSKTTLRGRIHILPQAQKSDAAFNVRSLLLSRGAELNAKPELEIYADDVACAHGATVGELDAASIFYLRSRGLTEQAARAALAYAHLATVIEAVEDEHLADYLSAAFKAAFDRTFGEAGDASVNSAGAP
jgi:Fe-S cluster assembly protein SufD